MPGCWPGPSGLAATWLRAVLTVPLVLPPVVGGVALLLAYGRNGVVGARLDELFGVTIPFTPFAVVLAEVFVAMPFYVVAVEGAMRQARPSLRRARCDARCLAVAHLHPSGPAARRPGDRGRRRAGLGPRPRRVRGDDHLRRQLRRHDPDRTALAVYTALEQDPQAAIALSVVMLAVSVVVLGALRGRWLR